MSSDTFVIHGLDEPITSREAPALSWYERVRTGSEFQMRWFECRRSGREERKGDVKLST